MTKPEFLTWLDRLRAVVEAGDVVVRIADHHLIYCDDRELIIDERGARMEPDEVSVHGEGFEFKVEAMYRKSKRVKEEDMENHFVEVNEGGACQS